MRIHRVTLAVVALAAPGALLAQAKLAVAKPPVAQVWIDVATSAGMGMPAGGANPIGAVMGAMFGGGSTKNSFGNTQTTPPGRWVDQQPAIASGR